MPHCKKCNKGQAKLNPPDDLCKECHLQKYGDDNFNMSISTSQLSSCNNSTFFLDHPTSVQSSFGLGLNTLSSPGNYTFGDPNLSNMSRHIVPQQPFSSLGPAPQPMQTRASAPEFNANTPVSAMTAGQMLALIQSQTKPLENKVESIDQKLDMEINGLKTRINVLENEVKEQKEKNDTLTQIVVEMQKSLNKIDNNDRERNLMISGLPEEQIEVNDVLLQSDNEKVAKMFSLLEIEGGPWNVERIGRQPTNGKTRISKVIFPDKETRDKAAEQSIKLKDLQEPWKKVYLNRDKHPVYRYENNRLRMKMKDLRKKPEFQDNSRERVKINKGQLTVDGTVVDRNTFSSFQ